MTDVSTRFETVGDLGEIVAHGDWQFVAPDLESDASPESAVLLSLFTDRLAEPDDVLPDSQSSDRRGWWADTNSPEGPLGSKLWLLVREKVTETVRVRAEQYAAEALQWMVDDDVADSITVAAAWSRQTPGMLMIEVGLYRDARLVWSKPFPWVWQAVQRGDF
jgi:phage gp46-like protein